MTAPPTAASAVSRERWPVDWPSPATAARPVTATWWGRPAQASPPPVVVYGDFTCPYSFLASQRVDGLAAAGVAAVQWRAVEHDRGVPPAGRLGLTDPGWRREMTQVAALALPGERMPAEPPVMVSNTHAAVYLYAWAGVSDRSLVRRRLFQAVWVDGLSVGSIEDLLALLGREAVRPALSGSAGLRLRQWRAQWRQVSGRPLPAVVRPADGVVVTGGDALGYLAGLLTGAAANPASPRVSPS